MGGLGNQMFQYALGKRMAAFHNTQLKLDVCYYNTQAGHVTPRKYELGCFNIQEDFASFEDISKIKTNQSTLIQKILREVKPDSCHFYKERNENFDKNVLLVS